MITAGASYMASLYMVGLSVSVTKTEMRPVKQQDGQIFLEPHPIIESFKGYPQVRVTAVHDIEQDRSFDVILGMNMLWHFHITMYQGQITISILPTTL